MEHTTPIETTEPRTILSGDTSGYPNGSNQSELRKCRICGCTDNNCSQCIEKTGAPCHWIEDDLCSACADVYRNEDTIPVIDTRASQMTGFRAPAGFFQRLAQLGNVDVTMRIMRVGEKLTINVIPGSKSRILTPATFTGTPEEFDQSFFDVVVPTMEKTGTGITTTVKEGVLQVADESGNDDQKTSSASKPAKPQQKKKSAAKKPATKAKAKPVTKDKKSDNKKDKKAPAAKKQPAAKPKEVAPAAEPQQEAAEVKAPAEPTLFD